LSSDEIITPAVLFACTEKRFLAFAAATLGGHLAQSSAARRIKGSNSKSRERAPFIAVEGKQLTSLVREDRCEFVRPLRGRRKIRMASAAFLPSIASDS
jgi:hypothetical protein